MIHRNVQPDCTTADFLHQMEQCLIETVGFGILFAVKEHFSFTQLLGAQDGREDRVRLVEHQGEHGVPLPWGSRLGGGHPQERTTQTDNHPPDPKPRPDNQPIISISMTVLFVVPIQFFLCIVLRSVSFVVLALLCPVFVHFVSGPGTLSAKELSFGIYM